MSERSPCRAVLADIAVGDDLPVAVVGALNVSPESFYAGSIHLVPDRLLRAAEAMVDAGVAFIDVGAMSTAPYLATAISEAEERDRLASAVESLATKLPVPISADTARRAPAEAAINAGARILNDVTGLADVGVARLAAGRGVSVILMASPQAGRLGGRSETTLASTVEAEFDARASDDPDYTGLRTTPEPPSYPGGITGLGGRPDPARRPVTLVTRILRRLLQRAREAGIADERIVLDPGIGFFLTEPDARARWDVTILANLDRFLRLGRPLCVAVSRKSFVGTVTGRRAPAERLAGSLAATAAAVLRGAAVIRTHDVAETIDAVRMAEQIRRVGQS